MDVLDLQEHGSLVKDVLAKRDVIDWDREVKIIWLKTLKIFVCVVTVREDQNRHEGYNHVGGAIREDLQSACRVSQYRVHEKRGLKGGKWISISMSWKVREDMKDDLEDEVSKMKAARMEEIRNLGIILKFMSKSFEVAIRFLSS
ncbi:hypothetical protein PM082_002679 [Marasmius tenuissimus]|nr:hypothetical protein PM082_002679 [Marasmius tenuissimus]